MMPRLYQIAAWDATFENAKSRQTAACHFVCLPNKQDGLGLTRILSLHDGAAVFGVWCLIVQAASRQRCGRNGWLTEDGCRDGTPWRIDEMALRWRRTESEIRRALDVCANVGWLNDFGDIVARPVTAVAPSVTAVDGGSESVDDGHLKEGRKEGRKEAVTDGDDIDFGEDDDEPIRPVDAKPGLVELSMIPGLKLTADSKPAWLALADEVGLTLIREARDQLIAAGRDCWCADVASAAYRLKANSETAARSREAARREREAAEERDRKIAEGEAAALIEARALVAELDADPERFAALPFDVRTRVEAVRKAAAVGRVSRMALYDLKHRMPAPVPT
jgi:hypothetical protein